MVPWLFCAQIRDRLENAEISHPKMVEYSNILLQVFGNWALLCLSSAAARGRLPWVRRAVAWAPSSARRATVPWTRNLGRGRTGPDSGKFRGVVVWSGPLFCSRAREGDVGMNDATQARQDQDEGH